MYRIILIVTAAAPLFSQTVEDAVAKQRESLAKQQASVQRQKTAAGGDSFFSLPRATGLGGVTTAPACDPLPSSEVNELVGKTATQEGVSPDLLRTVMKQESGFRPCAVSSKGAIGLMQLMPETAEQFGSTDPFNPASNVDAGARFLKQLLTKYGGDLPKTLGAYNAGPAKVDAAGTVPAIPETMEYVRQILAALPFK